MQRDAATVACRYTAAASGHASTSLPLLVRLNLPEHTTPLGLALQAIHRHPHGQPLRARLGRAGWPATSRSLRRRRCRPRWQCPNLLAARPNHPLRQSRGRSRGTTPHRSLWPALSTTCRPQSPSPTSRLARAAGMWRTYVASGCSPSPAPSATRRTAPMRRRRGRDSPQERRDVTLPVCHRALSNAKRLQRPFRSRRKAQRSALVVPTARLHSVVPFRAVATFQRMAHAAATSCWVLGNGTDGNPDASRTWPRAPESRTHSRTPTAGA